MRTTLRNALLGSSVLVLASLSSLSALAQPQVGPGGVVVRPYAHAAAPPVVSGTCSPTKVKFVASNDSGAQTTSSTFTAVPDTTIPFGQGGTVPSCIYVTFSANAYAPNGNLMQVRATLDGQAVFTPSDTQFAAEDANVASVRTAEFFIPNVKPGRHTLVIEFNSFNGAGTVTINQHTTRVSFAP